MAKATLDDIKNRRSIRVFKNEPIKREELDTILEAGTYAPRWATPTAPFLPPRYAKMGL
jgi:nitroreductase